METYQRALSIARARTTRSNSTAGYSGDGEPAAAAERDSPRGTALDSAGDLFFADWGDKKSKPDTPLSRRGLNWSCLQSASRESAALRQIQDGGPDGRRQAVPDRDQLP
jgi:hypothetical protein